MLSENNLFIRHLNTRGKDKRKVFIMVESRVLKSRGNYYEPSQKTIFTL